MHTTCSTPLTQHTADPSSLRLTFLYCLSTPPLSLSLSHNHQMTNLFVFWIILQLVLSSKASHFVTLSLPQDFIMALSTLLRGSVREKLTWTFNLYDINRDGYINKEVCVYLNIACGYFTI